MRPRWHDWVIVLAIVALAGTGIATIWGDEIARLWRGQGAAQENGEPSVTPASPAGAL